MTSLIAELFEQINKKPPNLALEWMPLGSNLPTAVADEKIDLTSMGADQPLPDQLVEKRLPTLQRHTFMRPGHPALRNWNMRAWLEWPRAIVTLARAARRTVEDQMRRVGLERQVGALLSEFSDVAPLIARTNMLWTTFKPFMVQDVETYRPVTMRPAVSVPDFEFRFLWSARLSADPGKRWLRETVIGAYEKLAVRASTVGEPTP